MYIQENTLSVYDVGLSKGFGKKFKKVTKKIGKAPKRLVKLVKKSPLILAGGLMPIAGGAALVMGKKTRKKIFKPIAKMAGKTVKAVAGVVTAPARMMVGGMQTGFQFGKALFKKKPKAEEVTEEAAPAEVAPEAAPEEVTPAEVVDTTGQEPQYEQETGPAEAPTYEPAPSYAAPAETAETPEETAEEETEPETVAPEEEAPALVTEEAPEGGVEPTAGPSSTMFETDQGGAEMMLNAVGLAGDLGFAPAAVAAGAKILQSGAAKKIFGGIGKLFKKKKKGAAPVSAPAPVPGLKKITSSAAMPKWLMPVGIGIVALLVVSQMGGGDSERRQITVIK